MHSSAKMGEPAATLPTTGIRLARGSISSPTARPAGEARVMARVLPSALTIMPASSSPFRWKWTVEGDFKPTAAPISRTEGG